MSAVYIWANKSYSFSFSSSGGDWKLFFTKYFPILLRAKKSPLNSQRKSIVVDRQNRFFFLRKSENKVWTQNPENSVVDDDLSQIFARKIYGEKIYKWIIDTYNSREGQGAEYLIRICKFYFWKILFIFEQSLLIVWTANKEWKFPQRV